MKVLGVVPARGGSKGIPRKNVALLAGKPLIAYTLAAASHSRLLTRLVVSTEDSGIAALGREYGVDVVRRPPEMAQDQSPIVDAVIHALKQEEATRGVKFDYALLLQPTSPFRSGEDIDGAIRLAQQTNADSVIGVCAAFSHPYLAFRIDPADGVLHQFVESDLDGFMRQSIPPAYVVNGAIYLTKRIVLLDKLTFFPEGSLGYIMPHERSLDIDTPWDLYLADLIMRNPWRDTASDETGQSDLDYGSG